MKLSKSRKSSRSRSSTTDVNASNATGTLSKPLTPLRRFFFKLELLGSSPSVPSFLGKRRRDELPEHEAGFQHLHAYDHGANIENALVSRQVVEDVAIAASTEVYAEDGTRKWTKKPAGPRFHKKASTSDPPAATEGGSHPLTTPYPTRRDRSSRVALQNIDTFLGEDAVIITALDNIPFDRHEELLSMSREELVHVALDLNSKLPRALAIDTSEDRPLTFIRNAIEVLVGIRPEVPAAPLRVGTMKIPVGSDQSRFSEEFSFESQLEDSSPLTTPLTSRKRVNGNGGLYNIPRVHPQRLETLEEAEVEEESVHRESFGRKRRRLSDENEDSDITMRSDSARSLVQPNSNLLQPPPMPREPIDSFLPPLSTFPPRSPPRRVLRSHSRKLRANAQGMNSFSTALASVVLESGYEARARRRRRANNNGNGNVKRNRGVSSKFTANSEASEDQRNSIVFPTNQSSCVINNVLRQGSSESSQGNTSTNSSDAILSTSSSRLTKSSLRSTQSGRRSTTGSEPDSAYSSVSKMSICTRSTRGRLAASSSGYSGDSSAMSRGDLGASMDVSL